MNLDSSTIIAADALSRPLNPKVDNIVGLSLTIEADIGNTIHSILNAMGHITAKQQYSSNAFLLLVKANIRLHVQYLFMSFH
jgi:hypothetical protein